MSKSKSKSKSNLKLLKNHCYLTAGDDIMLSGWAHKVLRYIRKDEYNSNVIWFKLYNGHAEYHTSKDSVTYLGKELSTLEKIIYGVR